MSFGDFLENELLDHVWGASAYTPPGTLYIGLSTTQPTDAGGNINEPSGAAGYARVASVNNLTNWPAAVSGAKANGVALAFPTATASWGTVGYFVVMDLASGGNMLGWGQLTNPKTIDAGDTASFAIGDLDVTLD
jgi:hypothetical protein